MNILAVGCHPDDLEIGCGGTLARYAQEGHRVTMVHVTNGNMGHVEIRPEELREIRLKEAEKGALTLGADGILTLDIGDLVVNANQHGPIERMVAIIRDIQPDVIITHSPDDYMKDHVEVSKLVFDASFSASVPHFAEDEPRTVPDPLPSAQITPLYYMDTLAGVNFQPSEYVDITSTIEIKIRALDCHASQVKWMLAHDQIDFLEFVRTVARFRGLQCGAAYAEGFRSCQTWPRLTTRRWLP